jgi:hypothetical protein
MNIKGIRVREKEVMLSQFADDTALFLDGSEQTFVEAVRLLRQFASMPGLNINLKKKKPSSLDWQHERIWNSLFKRHELLLGPGNF